MANVIVAKDAGSVADELMRVVKKHYDANPDDFIIGLSGGSLPKFFAAGLDTDLGKAIDWTKVRFFFCDERMVAASDPDSTLGAYLDATGHVVAAGQFMGVDTGLPVGAAADGYEARLRAARPSMRFDLLLLGMGPDGHTCSLFPGHALLDVADAGVAAISDSPKPPPNRVTLTLPAINKAKAVAFVSTGEGKKDVVASVLKANDKRYPAARVQPEDGDLYWIIDEPAASKL